MEKDKSEGKTILIILIVLFIAIFLWVFIGTKKTKKEEDWLMKNGTRTIAFYDYTGGKYGDCFHYSFKVNEVYYDCFTANNFVRDETFPYKKIPILVAYDVNNPKRNIALVNEQFQYKEYEIIYIPQKAGQTGPCFMEFRKVEN